MVIETTLAGWELASSVCAEKHAGWFQNVVSMSRNSTVDIFTETGLLWDLKSWINYKRPILIQRLTAMLRCVTAPRLTKSSPCVRAQGWAWNSECRLILTTQHWQPNTHMYAYQNRSSPFNIVIHIYVYICTCGFSVCVWLGERVCVASPYSPNLINWNQKLSWKSCKKIKSGSQ